MQGVDGNRPNSAAANDDIALPAAARAPDRTPRLSELQSETAQPQAIDDATLLTGLRAGDRVAQERFVRQFGGRMIAVARRFLPIEHDHADAVQEAFISAFQSLQSFEGASQLSTWLHRIVVNVCLMKLRSRSRRDEKSIESLLPTFDDTGHHVAPPRWSGDAVERLAVEERRAQVRACIDQLPESYRTVLLLRDIEECDTEETARRLDMTPANVKTRLHRARQALRTLLEPIFCEES